MEAPTITIGLSNRLPWLMSCLMICVLESQVFSHAVLEDELSSPASLLLTLFLFLGAIEVVY